MIEPDSSKGLKRPIQLDQLLPSIKQSINLQPLDQSPYFIHIAGQSAVGKSTISNLLVSGLIHSRVLNLDDYLRGREAGILNHDSGDPNKPFFARLNPAVYDLDQLYHDLIDLRSARGIEKPIFDEVTKSRIGISHFPPAKILIFEGIYALSTPFRNLADFGVLIEAPLHDRLMRILVRNHIFYRQEVNDIVERYLTQDEPTYTFYRRELHETADLVVDNPANPIVDYQAILQQGNYTNTQEKTHAFPKAGYGTLSTTENLTFTPDNQGQIILEYIVANKLLVRGPVATDTYRLVQNFYNVEN